MGTTSPSDARLAYSVREAADVVGVSERHLESAIDRGDLAVRYSGRRKLITRDDLVAWLASLPTERVVDD